MTDDSARRIAADYLAALDDREASEFIAEARASQQAMKDYARSLFAPTDDDNATRRFFGIRTDPKE